MKPVSIRAIASTLALIGENGIPADDFKNFSSFGGDYGLGYLDHSRAVEFLLAEGAIAEEQGHLVLRQLVSSAWVMESLLSGDAWLLSKLNSLPTRIWKFEPDRAVLREIGLAGEEFVIECLRSTLDRDLHHSIEHVSLTNDAAGFDIRAMSVYESRGPLMLEIKSTVSTGRRFRFFLSRNEANVGATNSSWYLVFVRKTQAGWELLGHVPSRDVAPLLPQDRSGNLQWSEVSGSVPLDAIFPGLP
jgi:hypothetical protein